MTSQEKTLDSVRSYVESIESKKERHEKSHFSK